MSPPSILRHPAARTADDVMPRPLLEPPASASPGITPATRRHIWDLAGSLHCSVIGTCLTAGELRRIFVRLDHADARTASDHSLHSRAVGGAGRNDLTGKMLNKALDKKHETTVRRFGKARSADEVRALWQEALERGDIPGACWAVFTHPATDRTLLADVFGEVHMLSHLVGMSNRADIARLRLLERDLAARDEKIVRQQSRLQDAATERVRLGQRVEELEAERRTTPRTPPTPRPPSAGELEMLRTRLADEQARARLLLARLDEQAQHLAAAQAKITALEEETGTQAREIAALEALLEPADMPADTTPESLAGRTLLYVGGRPRLLDQLRQQVEHRHGRLLAHDGGMEDKTSLLPGLISQADTVFFPVDCVSHRAAEQVKRLCQQTSKPFIPLRSASLASFLGALAPE